MRNIATALLVRSFMVSFPAFLTISLRDHSKWLVEHCSCLENQSLVCDMGVILVLYKNKINSVDLKANVISYDRSSIPVGSNLQERRYQFHTRPS